jgi:hypothetical protein
MTVTVLGIVGNLGDVSLSQYYQQLTDMIESPQW